MSNAIIVQDSMDRFIACMIQAVRQACSRLKEDDGTITYENAKRVVADVQKVFLDTINTVPEELRLMCNMVLSPLSPSELENAKSLNSLLCVGLGVSGIGLVVTGVSKACGWGNGFWQVIIDFFKGRSVVAIVVHIIAGMILTITAGYFMSKDCVPKADVFENSLCNGVSEVVKGIWQQYGDRLVNAVQK